MILMKRKLDGINGEKIVETVIKSISASVGMGAVIWFVERFMNPNAPGRYVVISILMGLLTYGLLLVLMRSSEIRYVNSLIKTRFSKKRF